MWHHVSVSTGCLSCSWTNLHDTLGCLVWPLFYRVGSFPGTCALFGPVSPSSGVSLKERGLSGPCTNCPDMTLGRQQHALFHIITFYYTSANDRDSNHSVQLAPWPNDWPCFVRSECVCDLLRYLSRCKDQLSMVKQAWWWLPLL